MINSQPTLSQAAKPDYFFYELHEFDAPTEKDLQAMNQLLDYASFCNERLVQASQSLNGQWSGAVLMQGTQALWAAYQPQSTWQAFLTATKRLAHSHGKNATGAAIDMATSVFTQNCIGVGQTGWTDRDGAPWLDWLAKHDPEHRQAYRPAPIQDFMLGYLNFTVAPTTRRKIILKLHKAAEWDKVNTKWTDKTCWVIPGTGNHFWIYSRHATSLAWMHKHHSVKPDTPAITVTNHSIEVSGVDKYDSNLKPRPAEELAWHWNTDETMQKLQAAFQTEWTQQPAERDPRVLVQALGELKRYADHRAWVTLNTLVEEPVAGVKIVDETTTDFAKSLVYKAADNARRRQIPVTIADADN